jgi:arsenate reductase (glutaredoxin)
MAELIVYGIKNCSTVKKAVTWLDENSVPYTFHDYKIKGISDEKLREWADQLGWESLINKKGMTWRQLDDETKEKIRSAAAAISLMRDKTSVIKRPLIERGKKVVALGFDVGELAKIKKLK